MKRPFAEPRLEGRLKWMMAVRLAVALLCLAEILVVETGVRSFSPQPRYLVLTFACVVNLAYLLAARFGADPRKQAILQLAVDVVLVTLLVYLVGPQRLYVALYFGVVIGGAAVMGLRTALSIAAQAALFLGGVAALYYFYADSKSLWMAEPAALQNTDTRISFLAPYTGFYALGLFAVAFLAGKLSEEARQIRILNEEILQNMMGGVVAINRLGSIAYMNAQAKRMLGMERAKTGADYAEVMNGDVAKFFRRALDKGERIEEEIAVNGVPLEVSIAPLTDGRAGNLRGVVAIVNDLSLRSEVERMTQQAARFRALLEMSAGIAHEIRNPIASIRGAAQELHSASYPDPDDRKLLDVVMRESDRLNRIVSDFLAYASDRPVETSLCNVADVLREVADLLRERDAEGKMTVDLNVPKAMICRGAPERLRMAFLNLGLNALEAVPKGGRLVVTCVPESSPEGPPRDGAVVEFEDTGTGIPQEHITRIFDPFFTTKPKGTGMGLAIARKIVHEHRGSIAVENVPGKGARFRVWLPAD